MDISLIISSQWYEYVILPFLIFFARLTDVSMGTIRVIFITRGLKLLAFLVGFFEILIWLAVINQIFSEELSFISVIAYALGFASGNFVGILIEKKLSFGKVIVRIIANKEYSKLIKDLNNATYSITSVPAESPEGKVRLIIAVTSRHDIPKIIDTIRQHNPHAFYSIEDVRYAFEEHNMGASKKDKTHHKLSKKGK